MKYILLVLLFVLSMNVSANCIQSQIIADRAGFNGSYERNSSRMMDKETSRSIVLGSCSHGFSERPLIFKADEETNEIIVGEIENRKIEKRKKWLKSI